MQQPEVVQQMKDEVTEKREKDKGISGQITSKARKDGPVEVREVVKRGF